MQDEALLQSLGLTDSGAEVYAALLKLDKARVREISAMVSVPRSQIYSALKSLVDRGVCRESRGKVNHYSAAAPDVVLR